jgi:enoyl-CoA hydratase/carnithine racemase
MDYKYLIYEKLGKKVLITLNRPDSLNALSIALKKELTTALEAADADSDVRTIVITGAGDRAFCAGQELHETKDTDVNDAETAAYNWIADFKTLYEAFRRQNKVTIAMINGAAAGSGLQITLLCDFRYMSSKAKVGMTEIDVGFSLITGSAVLWNVVGPARTKDLALTGRLIDATEALEWGLVNKVFAPEELRTKTLEFADFMAEKAPIATACDKEFYRLLESELYHLAFDQAVVAHRKGYASGEPQIYQKKFFEERAKKRK